MRNDQQELLGELKNQHRNRCLPSIENGAYPSTQIGGGRPIFELLPSTETGAVLMNPFHGCIPTRAGNLQTARKESANDKKIP